MYIRSPEEFRLELSMCVSPNIGLVRKRNATVRGVNSLRAAFQRCFRIWQSTLKGNKTPFVSSSCPPRWYI